MLLELLELLELQEQLDLLVLLVLRVLLELRVLLDLKDQRGVEVGEVQLFLPLCLLTLAVSPLLPMPVLMAFLPLLATLIGLLLRLFIQGVPGNYVRC